ncbi:MAG: hypothetical protein M1814_005727 [Vezdaea aestivalis]|nr:MAG: hypothetical protein M1814_005727 [Vezdaea aestivalis]
MKFGKELESDLVPEWRAKYFDYRTGKKRLNAVSKALKSVNNTPRTPRRRTADLWHGLNQQNSASQSPFNRTRPRSFLNRQSVGYTDPDGTGDYLRHAKPPSRHDTSSSEGDLEEGRDDVGQIRIPRKDIRVSNTTSFSNSDPEDLKCGSLIATPPLERFPSPPPSLDLPDPAIDPDSEAGSDPRWRQSDHSAATIVLKNHDGEGTPRISRFLPRRKTFTGTEEQTKRPLSVRLFSSRQLKPSGHNDIPLEAYRQFEFRQQEFFHWMDTELKKIETFYIEKEEEANERLMVLKDQLHVMKDRRLDEISRAQKLKDKTNRDERKSLMAYQDKIVTYGPLHSRVSWMKPLENVFDSARGKPQAHNIGSGTRALHDLGSPPGPRPTSKRDSIRRPLPTDTVPYRTAKRKLKLALQEYYRGLELLKSYSLLNRTAFRKITKKYDKAVNAKPTGRYMSEKVNKAYFVQSEVLDGHLHAVEDLYARYFERGNSKIAIGKLRSKTTKGGEFYSNVCRNGLALGAGTVFGIQGLIYGSRLLNDTDLAIRTNTSYLLQIYAGYFLSLLLFLLFCLNCKIWNSAKINYVFIFEFDTHHNLDWRQLSELPCIFVLLEGLLIWLNFNRYGGDRLFIYYPVLLIGITALLLAFPAKILYHRSRRWWLYSNWRLLLAGLYPVEFRDFFLGDMYCSQTYTMGNLELFFCLYACHWDPTRIGQCTSQHSMLLGFFSTLPGIWRALQCLRRYYDTRNVFPHLVNAGKYSCTILFYMTLSLYRIHQTEQLRALFIFCATINSIYCSIWDLIMDWSLGNPYSRNPYLRDVLGYKQPWIYYLAMVIDPILRFNWIFYALYSDDLQHSAILSFAVSLSEVFRRGLWTLFRVENEHCTNVGRFRASRDIPLPYDFETPSTDTDGTIREPSDPQQASSRTQAAKGKTTGGLSTLQQAKSSSVTDIERQDQPSGQASGTLRHRPLRASGSQAGGIARVGTLLSQAHAQDFERRRKPGVTSNDEEEAHANDAVDSSDEEDEDEDDLEEESGRYLEQMDSPPPVQRVGESSRSARRNAK